MKITKRGIFDSLDDSWWEQKRGLHHTDLSNEFASALTIEYRKYTEEIMHGIYDESSMDSKEAEFVNSIKDRIAKWDMLKAKLLSHARKALTDFDSYSGGFMLLSSMPAEEKAWLHAALKSEVISKYKIKDWISAVEETVALVDNDLKNVKEKKAAIKALSDATDKLLVIFSGRGYFYA
ncbi:MAG: hypothetical protein L7F78_11930 [Syntrophales bacterium LBB04]|nr:hypothetical protein [Syntrophales bacterium LBB04]